MPLLALRSTGLFRASHLSLRFPRYRKGPLATAAALTAAALTAAARAAATTAAARAAAAATTAAATAAAPDTEAVAAVPIINRGRLAPPLQAHSLLQQQQQLSTAAASTAFSSAAWGPASSTCERPSEGAPLLGAPAAFSSVQLPGYIQHLQLGHWSVCFYPIPQYLKSIEGPPGGGGPGGLPESSPGTPSSWEAASLVAALQPEMLCLECCSSRLQELAAAARTAAAAAAANGVSLQEEVRKQQRRLAKGFSLLTSFDGGLLHAALLPVVVAALTSEGPLRVSPAAPLEGPLGSPGVPGGPFGGPSQQQIYAIDRDRVTTARRLHECLLLQPSQLRALRRCVLETLSCRWAWGPPYSVGAPFSAGAALSWEAPQWAEQQKENFPSGFKVLLEERASCAAASLWNSIQNAHNPDTGRPSHGGPRGEGPSHRGPQGGGPSHGGLESSQTDQFSAASWGPSGGPTTGGTPKGQPVCLVFCSAALLPLLMESLQQLHALEAPAAAAAAARRDEHRVSVAAALHRSPPCLLPLLLLRFLVLPAAAAYAIAAAAAAVSSWVRGCMQRGDPPAATAEGLHVAIDEALERGPPRGAPERGLPGAPGSTRGQGLVGSLL